MIVCTIFSPPLLYLISSLLTSLIMISEENSDCEKNHHIFLATNGVHLEIIIPSEYLLPEDKIELNIDYNHEFASFSWGEKEFYLNSPSWDDLTISTAINALFFSEASLMHVVRYKNQYSDWIKIPVCIDQYMTIKKSIFNSFDSDAEGNKILLPGKGYWVNDDFYEGRGNYSLFYTCNTWVNEIFKDAGLTSVLWTPYEFGLWNQYEQ